MSNSVEAALKKTKTVNVNESWFEVLRLPNDAYPIAEPRHWQEVISFLIIGSQKAVLLDTGMGIKDISKAVSQLTDPEAVVVNSHTHFDHIGDDHRFSRIFVYSHAKPLVDPVVLYDVAKAFEIVNKGQAQHEHAEMYGQELRVYEFDGFAIATG